MLFNSSGCQVYFEGSMYRVVVAGGKLSFLFNWRWRVQVLLLFALLSNKGGYLIGHHPCELFDIGRALINVFDVTDVNDKLCAFTPS